MSDFTTIWKLVSAVPEGHVVTYGQIARKLGNSRASRLVVWALHQAPPDVPCHRVVNKSGQLSTAFQPFGRQTHQMLLEREGIRFAQPETVDLQTYQWFYPDTSENYGDLPCCQE